MQIGPKSNSIGAYGLRNAVRTVNNLRNIDFDSNFSYAYDGSGVHISAKPNLNKDALENYHFKIESNTASSTNGDIIIRGGFWIRESGDDRQIVGSKNDDGSDYHIVSNSYSEQYTSLSCGNAAPKYIYLETNVAMRPTTVEIKQSTTWPTNEEPEKSKLVLGWVYSNTSSSQLEINQFWIGDTQDYWERPDSDNLDAPNLRSSIDRNSSGDLELFSFDLSALPEYCVEIGGVPGGEKHIVYGITDNTPTDCDTSASNPGTFGLGLSRGDHRHKILDSDHATASDWATYANSGAWPTTFDHGAYNMIGNILEDIKNGIAPDGHNSLTTSTGNYPYISGRGVAREGNKFLTGATIDDNTGAESIAPNERTLNYADSIYTLNWGCCFCQTITSEITIKWNNQELLTDNDRDLCWASATHELTNSWSCTKTFNAKKYQMSDDSANDYWDAATFKVTSTSVVDIYGGTSLTVQAAGGRAIVLGADIDLQTSALKINGTPGISMSGYNVIDNLGNLHPIATTLGLLTTG